MKTYTLSALLVLMLILQACFPQSEIKVALPNKNVQLNAMIPIQYEGIGQLKLDDIERRISLQKDCKPKGISVEDNSANTETNTGTNNGNDKTTQKSIQSQNASNQSQAVDLFAIIKSGNTKKQKTLSEEDDANSEESEIAQVTRAQKQVDAAENSLQKTTLYVIPGRLYPGTEYCLHIESLYKKTKNLDQTTLKTRFDFKTVGSEDTNPPESPYDTADNAQIFFPFHDDSKDKFISTLNLQPVVYFNSKSIDPKKAKASIEIQQVNEECTNYNGIEDCNDESTSLNSFAVSLLEDFHTAKSSDNKAGTTNQFVADYSFYSIDLSNSFTKENIKNLKYLTIQVSLPTDKNSTPISPPKDFIFKANINKDTNIESNDLEGITAQSTTLEYFQSIKKKINAELEEGSLQIGTSIVRVNVN